MKIFTRPKQVSWMNGQKVIGSYNSKYFLGVRTILIFLTFFSAMNFSYGNTAAYLTGNPVPWGVPPSNAGSNEASMDVVFGAGNWDDFRFTTVNAATLFSNAYTFIFIDGSDGTANQLNSFLSANLSLIETWVSNGGALILNAAPNQGGNINFGFGGFTLNYPSTTPSVNAVNSSHPIFNGIATSYTGSFFGHSIICPAGMSVTRLIENSSSGADILIELSYGNGVVLFGE